MRMEVGRLVPVLVYAKLGWIFSGLVQVVVDAALHIARLCNQIEQRFTDLVLMTCLGSEVSRLLEALFSLGCLLRRIGQCAQRLSEGCDLSLLPRHCLSPIRGDSLGNRSQTSTGTGRVAVVGQSSAHFPQRESSSVLSPSYTMKLLQSQVGTAGILAAPKDCRPLGTLNLR